MTLSVAAIRSKFEAALTSSGATATRDAVSRANPTDFTVRRAGQEARLRAYFLNVSGGGRSLADEHRIQLHRPIEPLWVGLTWILGYDAGRDVFVIFDGRAHLNHGSHATQQVREVDLIAAQSRLISAHRATRAGFEDIVLGAPPAIGSWAVDALFTSGRLQRGLKWYAENGGAVVAWPGALPDGTLLATRAKGIYKPSGSKYALSVRRTLRGPYVDSEVEWVGKAWALSYHEENDPNEFTNRALRANMADGVPVGVLEQVELGPRRNPYRVLGLGLVVGNENGFFEIAGPVAAPVAVPAAEGTSRRRRVPSREVTAVDELRRLLGEVGETDVPTHSTRRVEHGLLRRLLLGGLGHGLCAFCERDLPAQLLTAAHVKPRRDCTTAERKDLAVVVLACGLGCDRLFEEGYMWVDDTGSIQALVSALEGAGTPDPTGHLVGRRVSVFGPANAAYFEWHRDNRRHA